MLPLVYGIRVFSEPLGPSIHSGSEIAMFMAELTEVSLVQECFGVNGGKGLKVGHTLRKLNLNSRFTYT